MTPSWCCHCRDAPATRYSYYCVMCRAQAASPFHCFPDWLRARARQDFAVLRANERNLLVRHGWWTAAQVAATPDAWLLRLRNLGPRGLARIRAVCPAGAP